jgi:hypothetical protein
MRKIKRLSPTSLNVFESDRELFYTKYLSEACPEWEPQSPAMIVGSSFDAFVKSSLYYDLFGEQGEYGLNKLFEEQCTNEEIKDWAFDAGEHLFYKYVKHGCYQELLDELEKSEEPPRFEFTLFGDIEGVPVVGKPDMWYKRNVQVVLDWKVMGFCSSRPQSPKKLYKTCRDCWDASEAKPTRGGGEAKKHKHYKEMEHHGHLIGSHYLEEVDKKWADQIALYSWLLGVEIGNSDMVTCIDQLCAKPNEDRFPLIRVAQHRCRISENWQLKLRDRLVNCWETIQSGHIFDDMSREDSDARCEVLDMPQEEDDEFWSMVNERQYRG